MLVRQSNSAAHDRVFVHISDSVARACIQIAAGQAMRFADVDVRQAKQVPNLVIVRRLKNAFAVAGKVFDDGIHVEVRVQH